MAQIGQLLGELRFELGKVVVLNAFLDATILFLFALLIGNVFGMGLLYPIVLAVAFFVLQCWRYGHRLSLRYVEDRNPELREMLRTCQDNKSSNSLMAQALFAEVVEKVRRVSSGTFLDLRKVLLKIGIMFALSTVIVSLAFFNVSIQKFSNPLSGMEQRVSSFFHGSQVPLNQSGVSDAGDIYGEPSIAKLGNKQLDVQLQRNLNQIDFNSVSGADNSTQGDLNGYPVAVSAQASGAYTGGLEDVNDRKTAADYSQEVKK